MHPRDVLTPAQRFAALAQNDAPDRLPCVPIVGNTAARVIGVKVSRFRGSGKTIADAHLAAYERFGCDGIRIFTDLYTQAEAMGAKVVYPADETAYLQAPAIQSPDRIGNLKPADPWNDGFLADHLEAMERVVQAVGREVPVTGALTGSFTNASFLIGADTLVRLTIKNPAAVHALM